MGGVLGIHSPSLESWVCRPGEEEGEGRRRLTDRVPNVGGVLGIHSPSLESWVCRPGEEGVGAETTDRQGSLAPALSVH